MQMKHHLEHIPLDKFVARCDELASKGYWLISFVAAEGKQATCDKKGQLIIAQGGTVPVAVAMFGIPVQAAAQQQEQPAEPPAEEQTGPILLAAA